MSREEVLGLMGRLMLYAAIIALIALSVVAGANTVTVSAGSQWGITIDSPYPVVKMGSFAAARGELVLRPSAEMPEGICSVVIDGQTKFMSDLSMPEYILDTTKLEEGKHQLRIDCTDGQMLLASTGTIPLHIYNTTNQSLFKQSRTTGPAFFKVQRKIILREIVWFNAREADLEKHGFLRRGRVYITLTDLMRHIGGGIVWGPSRNYIEVHRNNMVVRIIPGSSRIYVDGNKQSLGRPAIRKESRTYVPVRPMCDLFGVHVDWNDLQNRALVSFSP